jgi:soluble lytic murein transglycosylase-like protein
MIESIQGALYRIHEITKRIDEISAFTKPPSINPTPGIQKQPDQQDPNQPNFSQILQDYMQQSASPSVPGKEMYLNDLSVDELVGTYQDSASILQSMYKSANAVNNDVDSIITEASQTFGVDESLVKAVIKQESQYNPKAVSKAGAMGLMQLMPQTAEILGVTDPFDVRQNIFGGTNYLSDMLTRFNGNVVKALAAYNAGPNKVDKAGGVPNIEETKDYVNKVMNFYYEYKNSK